MWNMVSARKYWVEFCFCILFQESTESHVWTNYELTWRCNMKKDGVQLKSMEVRPLAGRVTLNCWFTSSRKNHRYGFNERTLPHFTKAGPDFSLGKRGVTTAGRRMTTAPKPEALWRTATWQGWRRRRRQNPMILRQPKMFKEQTVFKMF